MWHLGLLPLIVTGWTFQMSSQYSAIDRSEENFPARAVENRHPRPGFRVLPGPVDLALATDVVRVVGEDQEGIVVDEVGHQRSEHRGVPAGEVAFRDEVDRAGEFRIAVEVVPRSITLRE